MVCCVPGLPGLRFSLLLQFAYYCWNYLFANFAKKWWLQFLKTKKSWTKKGDTWTPTRLETKNTVCPWRRGRRGRAQRLTVRGKSPQRTPLVGSCLPNQGVSSKQGAPLPRRASTEQTVSSPGQLDSARATSSRVAKARP